MTMTRPYIIITLAALPLMFTSCIKDEPLGMECDIEEAFIHADDPQAMFFQPSDSLTRVCLRLRGNTFLPQRSGAESENGPSPEKKNGANERGIDGKRSKESLLIVYVES